MINKDNIKNLFIRSKKSEIAYHFFSPKSDIENSKYYVDALKKSINANSVYNIAISGNLGSGKSSIVQAYLDSSKKNDKVLVSLADFTNDTSYNNGKKSDIVINEIFKQLFYSGDGSKYCASKYRPTKFISWTKFLITAYIFTFIALGSLYLFFQDIFASALISLDGCLNKSTLALSSLGILPSASKKIFISWCGIVFIVGSTCFFKLLYWCQTRISISEISVKDKFSIKRDAINYDNILDKNLQELFYFFKSTKTKVVIFEDLDRFNDNEIFITLRKLNNILNNSKFINGKISFVYALNDSTFVKEERTKFFDFIIPVIPITSHINSKEQLLKLFNFTSDYDGENDDDKIDGISKRCIEFLSNYFSNYRDICDLKNEYTIYLHQLQNVSKHTHYIDNEMLLTMIAFKSLYPLEFSKSYYGNGIIPTLLDTITSLRNSAQQKANSCSLSEKLASLEFIIEDLKEEFWNTLSIDLHDVSALHCYEKFSNMELKLNGLNPKTFCTDDYYSYRHPDTFSGTEVSNFDLITLNSCYLFVVEYETSSLVEYVIDELSESARMTLKKYTEYFKEYIELDNEKNCLLNIASLPIQSLLISGEKYYKDFIHPLEDLLQDYPFLFQALEKEFIDESLESHINYSFTNVLSRAETIYLNNILESKGQVLYNSHLDHVDYVLKKLNSDQFYKPEILNYNLVEHLLDKEINTKYQEHIQNMLSLFTFDDTYLNFFEGFFQYIALLHKENDLSIKFLKLFEKMLMKNLYERLPYGIQTAIVIKEHCNQIDQDVNRNNLTNRHLAWIIFIDYITKYHTEFMNDLPEMDLGNTIIELLLRSDVFSDLEKFQIIASSAITENFTNVIYDFIVKNHNYKIKDTSKSYLYNFWDSFNTITKKKILSQLPDADYDIMKDLLDYTDPFFYVILNADDSKEEKYDWSSLSEEERNINIILLGKLKDHKHVIDYNYCSEDNTILVAKAIQTSDSNIEITA